MLLFPNLGLFDGIQVGNVFEVFHHDQVGGMRIVSPNRQKFGCDGSEARIIDLRHFEFADMAIAKPKAVLINLVKGSQRLSAEHGHRTHHTDHLVVRGLGFDQKSR